MDENYDYSNRNLIREGVLHDLNIEQRVVSTAKSLAVKLNKEIEKGNDTGAFMTALLLAAFKDFLDIMLFLGLIGVIPGVTFLVGLFLTSFLFFFMLGKGWFLKWKVKFWYWVLGAFVDGLPVISLLPMCSILVLYAWRITKKKADKGKLKLKNLENLTFGEITALNNDIGLLEATDKDIEAITKYSTRVDKTAVFVKKLKDIKKGKNLQKTT